MKTGEKFDLIQHLITKDKSINYYYQQNGMTYAQLCNKLCSLAKGNILIPFQFNNLYSNHYITAMVDKLKMSRADFLKLSSWNLYNFSTNTFYTTDDMPYFNKINTVSNCAFKNKIKIKFEENNLEFDWIEKIKKKFRFKLISHNFQELVNIYLNISTSSDANLINYFRPIRLKLPREISESLTVLEKLTPYVLDVSPIMKNNKLELELPPIKYEDLPNMSILTITKDRDKYLKLGQYNFKNFTYPLEKIGMGYNRRLKKY